LTRSKTKDCPLEKYEQEMYFVQVRRHQLKHPDFAFIRSSMSGTPVHRSQIGRLQKQGRVAGYPDISWDFNNGKYCGMRIELKRRNATQSALSQDQRAWLEWLAMQGYYATWCRGWEEAWTATLNYFEGMV